VYSKLFGSHLPEPPVVPNSAPLLPLQTCADLPDPRMGRTRWHLLFDLLVIALCATLRGADGFNDMEEGEFPS
jgi:hypothetical protein